MKYEDINFTSNLISIWINKGDRPRSILMTRRARIILEERQHINQVKPFTITIDEAERAWQWMRADEVCQWLGTHSSIKMTERYAHLDSGKLVHAVEVLEL